MKKSFEDFVKSVQLKAPKRKPLKVKKPLSGTLFAKRNTRLAIRQGALRGVTVVILYKKVTTGQVKRYQIIPISYRYRKLKQGRRKVLFAQDFRDDKKIKYFLLKSIYKVALTDRKVKANWKVQIF